MEVWILVFVAMNFVLLCLNEYGSLQRAKATITMINELHEKVDKLQSSIDLIDESVTNVEAETTGVPIELYEED